RDPQPHLVTAGRVHVEDLGGKWLPEATMVRVLVMVQDHFLVHLLHPHQRSPKKSTARRTPATNRSTSSRVLYTANDARAVAAMPNLRCSGHAQWCPTRT